MTVQHRPRPRVFKTGEGEHLARDTDWGTQVPADTPAVAVPPPPRSTSRFGRWFGVALGGLVSIAIGLQVDALVAAAFARADWLGWLSLGLTGLLVLAVLSLALREFGALGRLKRIADLRSRAEMAETLHEARKTVAEVSRLYSGRPELDGARAGLKAAAADIIDADALIAEAERSLLLPLDRQATAVIRHSALRVAGITAVTPLAILDALVVGYESLRMINRVAEVYGGRPGIAATRRLMGRMMAGVIFAGAVEAAGDVFANLFGHWSRAATGRIGEGLINGTFAVRLGLAAMDACRPLPWRTAPRPGVTTLVRTIFPDATNSRS